MVYDLFDMLLNVVCQYFVEGFWVFTSMFIKELGLYSSFFVMSLPSLGMSVILAS
jgi:hypothetical protein